jgi:periplasmic copper chaperone A
VKRQKQLSRKLTAVSGLAVLGTLALASQAQAHVSLHPNTLPAGSFPTVDIRVPSEEPNANTSKLAVQFPPGFLDVSVGYMPGWKNRVITQKLATPIKTDQGTITEQVREVIWSGGKIPPDHFLDFPISTTIPDNAAGKSLAFKAIQTYDNGKVVRWIGPPSADQPAPTVNVTQKGGVLEDVGGTEAGPGSAQAASQTSGSTATKGSSSKKASKGLGIAALVVGIAALVAALIAMALVLGRRSRPART